MDISAKEIPRSSKESKEDEIKFQKLKKEIKNLKDEIIDLQLGLCQDTKIYCEYLEKENKDKLKIQFWQEETNFMGSRVELNILPSSKRKANSYLKRKTTSRNPIRARTLNLPQKQIISRHLTL